MSDGDGLVKELHGSTLNRPGQLLDQHGALSGVQGPAARGRLAHTRGRGEDRRPLIIHVKDCVCIESLFQYKNNL